MRKEEGKNNPDHHTIMHINHTERLPRRVRAEAPPGSRDAS